MSIPDVWHAGMRLMIEQELLQQRYARDVIEREYLRALKWSEKDLRRYQCRVLGVERRFARIMERRA